jgi:hypothetical protein
MLRNVRQHQVAPNDNSKFNLVLPQYNFMLPQKEIDHVCTKTSPTCFKFQSQNPTAQFAWKIRGLNPNSPSWLNHLHHYGAPPWWSRLQTHPMWVEHIWKDMSPSLAPPPPPPKCVTKKLANFYLNKVFNVEIYIYCTRFKRSYE